jgi:hypothetical protein
MLKLWVVSSKNEINMLNRNEQMVHLAFGYLTQTFIDCSRTVLE